MATTDSVASIFEKSQTMVALHLNFVRDLRRIQRKNSINFKKDFISQLNKILIASKRDLHTERLIQFLVKFAVFRDSEGDEFQEDFISFFLQYLLGLCDVKDKTVRFRCCQLISGLLGSNSFAEHISLDNQIEELLLAKMRERARDKVAVVRVEACRALCYMLDEAADPTDNTWNLLMEVMATDPSKEVRKCVVANIESSIYVIPELLKRLRDIDIDVRKEVVSVFKNKIPKEMLTVAQRVDFLKIGLNDPKEEVVTLCDEVLCIWLQAHNGDPLQLLDDFEAEKNEEVAELALRRIFSTQKIDLSRFKSEEIDIKFAIFWRVYCQWVKETKHWRDVEHIFENVLPEINKFCMLIKHYESNEAILRQLLSLASLLDYRHDEAGRRLVIRLLCDMLPRTTFLTVRKGMLKLLRCVCTNEDDYIRVVLEIISDVKEPLENSTDGERSKSEEEQKFLLCLDLTEELLQYTRKTLSHPGIAELLDSIILPAVQHESPEIRNAGVKCLGLYCFLDKCVAKRYVSLFLKIIANDRIKVRLTAIHILFDFMMLFGPNALSLNDSVSSKDTESVCNGRVTKDAEDESKFALMRLFDYLNDENEELRTAAVEGFCKLLYTDAIADIEVLTHLILEEVNPITEKFRKIRKCLEVFLPSYVLAAKTHRNLLERASISVLTRLIKVTPNSVLAPVSIKEVGRFLASLTDWEFIRPIVERDSNSKCRRDHEESDQTDKSIHNRIALALVKEIVLNPLGRAAVEFPSVLLSFSYNRDDVASILQLRALVDKATKYVKDPSALKQLAKLKLALFGLNDSPHKELSKDTNGKALGESNQNLLSNEDNHNIDKEKKRALKRTLSDILKEKREMFAQIDNYELSVNQPLKKRRVDRRVTLPQEFVNRQHTLHKIEQQKHRQMQLNKLLETLEQKIAQTNSTATTATAAATTKAVGSSIENARDNNHNPTITTGRHVGDNTLQNSNISPRQNKSPDPSNIHNLDVVKLIEHLKQEIKDLFAEQTKTIVPQTPPSINNSIPKANTTSKLKSVHFADTDNISHPALVSNPRDNKAQTILNSSVTSTHHNEEIKVAPSTTTNQTENLSPQHNLVAPESQNVTRHKSAPKPLSKTEKQKLIEKKKQQRQEKQLNEKTTPRHEKLKSKIENTRNNNSLRESRQTIDALGKREKNNHKIPRPHQRLEDSSLQQEEKRQLSLEHETASVGNIHVLANKVNSEAKTHPTLQKAMNSCDTTVRQLRTRKRKSSEMEKKTEEFFPQNEMQQQEKTMSQRPTKRRRLTERPQNASRDSKTADCPHSFDIVRSGKRHQSILYAKSEKAPKSVDLQTKKSSALLRSQRTRDKKRIVVVFSGFKEKDERYNFKQRKLLMEQVVQLGGKVLTGDFVDPSVTHIVSPPGYRTLKTLIGVVRGCWLLTPEWVTDSIRQGKFLPEDKYGTKKNEIPYSGKKIFISPAFKEANSQLNEEHVMALLQVFDRFFSVNMFISDIFQISLLDRQRMQLFFQVHLGPTMC